MEIKKNYYVITALVNPEKVVDFNLFQWSLLICQARRAGVLARIGYILETQQLLAKVPKEALKQIKSAEIYAQHVHRSLDWELQGLQRAFDSIGLPLVLLKGSLYVVANNRTAIGRVFSDIDLLVPEINLKQVERALNIEGWKAGYVNAYDQQYYRKWMHELPPMQHVQRHTSIDVHHNILPRTNKSYPDAKKLLANIVQIDNKNIWGLTPEYRVIHSATHLFNDGEFEHGFRDLSDMDLMLKEFSVQSGFWNRLIKGAEELHQQRSLYYALRYTRAIFDTSVPNSSIETIKQFQTGSVRERMMDFIFLRALMPDHKSCDDQWTGLARWIIYLRSHWLRMPLYLLVPHLIRKSWMRLAGETTH